MSAFTGTGTLTRFALRRDRVRLTVWTIAIGVLVWVTVAALEETFPTEQDRVARNLAMENPVAAIFSGPGYGLDELTFGPIVVSELLMILLIAITIMSALFVIRHTRTDEEAGRTELLRADVVGSAATMTSALIHCVVANTIMATVTGGLLIAFGLAVTDSLALALSVALTGVFFGAVAAAAAQIMEFSRAASGLAIGVLGALFVIRAAGDMADPGGTWVSWLSPFSWGAQMRPYADLRWWPLALYAVSILATAFLAFVLARRRDFGAGLVRPRAGRAAASPLLSSPLALLVRLQRGSTAAWTIGTFVLAAVFGAIVDTLDDLLSENPDLAEVFTSGGGDLIEGFIAFIAVYLTMAAAAWAIISVTRLKAEEQAGRAEALLATAAGRSRLLLSALAVSLVSSSAVLVAGGLGMGLAASLTLSDFSWLATALTAVSAQLVVPVIFAAATALLYGWSARLAAIAWAWFGIGVVISFFGVLWELPSWAMNLSPFELVGLVPAEDADLTAVFVVVIAAIVAAAGAVLGFRRRDLVTS